MYEQQTLNKKMMLGRIFMPKARILALISSILLLGFSLNISAQVVQGRANEKKEKQDIPVAVLEGKSKAAQKIHSGIVAKTPLYENKALSDYVTRVGLELVKNSDHAGRDYRFFILDDSGVNAFTPGHELIYFNRGLLTLLNSEGQLAGVLAHEIGHNTGNHLGRQRTQRVLGGVASTAAAILTRSNSIGDTINLVNQARISGFGREMELEADQYAAEYLYNTNYDPEEMLAVLGVLKDHETFSNLGKGGAGGGAYHGVFSTHPRSDKRLQEVIAQAGQLPPGEGFRGREEWRSILEGVVVGQNFTGNKGPNEDRYLNESLGITFVHPKDWSRSTKGSKIILKDPDETVQLKITIEKTVDKSLTSQQALEKKFPDDLSDVAPIDAESNRDLGTLAKRPTQRVALASVARNTYNFQGIARNNNLTAAQDAELVKIIKSFRRRVRADSSADAVKRIYYERLEPGDTFAVLAERIAPGKGQENWLRLMNGYFPKGEPEPGTWIKLYK